MIKDFLLFHEKVLRPLFHNFTTQEGDKEQDEEALWVKYKEFNFRFLDPIMSIMNANDLVWIHDTYLLLLPKHVRRNNINARIGFSMHSPFPSSDIYRMFQYRKMILKSLLCSDLIGFHIFEYARHFYIACQRLLSLNHEFK